MQGERKEPCSEAMRTLDRGERVWRGLACAYDTALRARREDLLRADRVDRPDRPDRVSECLVAATLG